MPISDLSLLSRTELAQLHAHGHCPNPESLHGVADGLILPVGGLQRLKIWRGKVFHHEAAGLVGGFNRIGLGPLEFRRYRFRASRARSIFSDRDVLLIDHNLPGNPDWVRRFHDELVEVSPGLYLASSHLRVRNQLRFMSYFTLDFMRRGA